jgi:hypothetical protein
MGYSNIQKRSRRVFTNNTPFLRSVRRFAAIPKNRPLSHIRCSLLDLVSRHPQYPLNRHQPC